MEHKKEEEKAIKENNPFSTHAGRIYEFRPMQLRSYKMTLLNDYNQYLLKNGFVDTDIEQEEHTIQDFINASK